VLRFTSPRKPKRYFAKTADGWRIALHRYEPDRKRPDQAPVLLCHGLGANRYNLDGPGALSMARKLCDAGYDCWVVELRGAGYSSHPRLWNRKRYDWLFDDYVSHDIPAALNRIQALTGHRQVHWIGHSMGGMVAYAYLLTQDSARIRTMTAIASPCFARGESWMLDKVIGLRGVLKLIKKLPYHGTGALLVPFMPLFKATLGHLFGNPQNLSTTDLSKLVVVTPTNLPTSLIYQFACWYAEDGFCDAYANVHYYRELHRITVPALLIAGAVDKLTPPEDIAYVHDHIGSADKTLMTFGKASGCRYDYGHIDLVLGKYAPEEVWPHIFDWLAAH